MFLVLEVHIPSYIFEFFFFSLLYYSLFPKEKKEDNQELVALKSSKEKVVCKLKGETIDKPCTHQPFLAFYKFCSFPILRRHYMKKNVAIYLVLIKLF